MADSFVDKYKARHRHPLNKLALDRHSSDRRVAAVVFLQLALGAGLVCRRLGVSISRSRDRRYAARLFP